MHSSPVVRVIKNALSTQQKCCVVMDDECWVQDTCRCSGCYGPSPNQIAGETLFDPCSGPNHGR